MPGGSMKQLDWVHDEEWMERAVQNGEDEAFSECKEAGVLKGTESQPKLALVVRILLKAGVPIRRP